VVQHANKGGYVMGICNGFQILTEAGLLPGALLRNVGQKFICDNVYIKPVTTNLLPTQNLELGKAYKIPVAHGEGRYHADKDTLRRMEDNNQIMFKYSSNVADTHEMYNINGSLLNIAGVANEQKNVFGMMPHPERAVDPELGNTDGRAIFESILNAVNA
jgi:phosphoribosylformylglycinamidine synthase subunit PurQ / glutaminase